MTNQLENPILIVSSGSNNGTRCVLENETFLVGRDPTCELALTEREISRHHIKVTRQSGKFFIEDLDSKNGTWVTGEQLKGERLLNDGDEINLGQVVKITFIESEATAPYTPDTAITVQGRLRLDRDARRVFVMDKEILPPLSLPQYRLLEMLFDAKGGVCTRDQVVRAVWPDALSEGVSEQAIDALVRRLRDRLSEIDPNRQYIITVRGHGFRLDQG